MIKCEFAEMANYNSELHRRNKVASAYSKYVEKRRMMPIYALASIEFVLCILATLIGCHIL